jgi:hypothetical protein
VVRDPRLGAAARDHLVRQRPVGLLRGELVRVAVHVEASPAAARALDPEQRDARLVAVRHHPHQAIDLLPGRLLADHGAQLWRRAGRARTQVAELLVLDLRLELRQEDEDDDGERQRRDRDEQQRQLVAQRPEALAARFHRSRKW